MELDQDAKAMLKRVLRDSEKCGQMSPRAPIHPASLRLLACTLAGLARLLVINFFFLSFLPQLSTALMPRPHVALRGSSSPLRLPVPAQSSVLTTAFSLDTCLVDETVSPIYPSLPVTLPPSSFSNPSISAQTLDTGEAQGPTQALFLAHPQSSLCILRCSRAGRFLTLVATA